MLEAGGSTFAVRSIKKTARVFSEKTGGSRVVGVNESNSGSRKGSPLTMGVTTPNNLMNEKTCKIEIEEDEEKMEHLAASIIFPLSKITQQNNAEGIKMRKHKLKSSHKQRMRPPTSPEEKECLAT